MNSPRAGFPYLAASRLAADPSAVTIMLPVPSQRRNPILPAAAVPAPADEMRSTKPSITTLARCICGEISAARIMAGSLYRAMSQRKMMPAVLVNRAPHLIILTGWGEIPSASQ